MQKLLNEAATLLIRRLIGLVWLVGDKVVAIGEVPLHGSGGNVPALFRNDPDQIGLCYALRSPHSQSIGDLRKVLSQDSQ
jgi:hypothetical protein